MDGDYFVQLLSAVRTGDDAAATELLREVEPYLRRVIRIRLSNQRVRHVVDTEDIFQTVMKDFFLALGKGRYEFESPKALRGLLARMVINRVIEKARREKRHPSPLPDECDTPDRRVGVEDRLAAAEDDCVKAELVARIQGRLGEQDAELFDQKYRLGRSWEEVARAAGETPAAIRMRLTRAIRRARLELAAPGESHVHARDD